ncbi:MAG: hypothetical protein P8Y02_11415, partial [Deinococcales bacterium]
GGSPQLGAVITQGVLVADDLAFDASGNLWVSSYGGWVTEFLASSLPSSPRAATIIGNLSTPVGLTFDGNGNLWVANSADGSLVEFLASSLGGTPQRGTTIQGLTTPYWLAFDPPAYDLPLAQ